ncbi:MAG: molybdopterin-dependent oxidoreductase [Planctomycetota bacterium]|nr:molybdopterin-dependent oxidoreductase [Planctomycetota bacterium]
MKPFDLSRRGLLAAASGAAITGIGWPVELGAQQNSQQEKDLVFRSSDPRNAEPELSKLVQSWITPTKHFYVRSHAPSPKIDAKRYMLTIEGLVRKSLTLSLGELQRMPRYQVTATLTCAGNRRAEFNEEGKVGGVQWGAGAIGNANWSGISLADVLKQAEILESAKHVWFEGQDEIKRKEGVIPFGGSVPIEKAMLSGRIPGTLLADQMNGEELTADHGYPLRTVVPGYIGARSVKWLGKIIVSDKPSPNHYLATAYKIVKKTDPIDWTESGPIYRYPINGAIATPKAQVRVPAGLINVSGYVLPTGRPGAQAQSVQISSDNGASWQATTLVGKVSDYCWQLWEGKVKVTPQTEKLLLRAFDSSGGFMPQRVPWNAKGYLQNSWFQLPLDVS